MDHDVGAVVDWPQQNRRRHGVVDNQRNAVLVGYPGQRLDIADVSGGIADAFAKDRPGLVVNVLFDGVRTIRCGKADRDALIGQKMGEQRMCRAIELRD